jgi:hypothetical protein
MSALNKSRICNFHNTQFENYITSSHLTFYFNNTNMAAMKTSEDGPKLE